MSAEPEDPKNGKDEEESGIPALYTYFGQFIDHDITFDPDSSLQKQNDPDALTDYRTPAFDLDSVYGRGPDDQPYMYDGGYSFLLGRAIHGGTDRDAFDLPRNGAPLERSRALIGDPRNDENVLISQLQGLLLRFHNRTLRDITRTVKDGKLAFAESQRLVRFHYQYVVLNDFLPQIVHSSVLRELKVDGKFKQEKLRFFRWKNEPFMPVEFSVAAYRFGHSMVRPGYRINDAKLLPIFPTPKHHEGLRGFRAMNSAWGIDWGRFINIDVRKYDGSNAAKARRLQFAYRIDTSLVSPLSHLPTSVASSPPFSLALRNLERGWRLGLPSGQEVARAMGVIPLADNDIIIGKAVKARRPSAPNILSISPIFKNNCPVWVYILAEAMLHQERVKIPVKENISIMTPRLGPVGGRILAEVFIGLMFGDKRSYLNLEPNWRPQAGPHYSLKDFIKYALGH
jgi:hypothetical protein